MISELSFLLELILDEATPQPIKTKLVRRVKEVEKNYTTHIPNVPQNVPRAIPKAAAPLVAAQSPSMQRLMENNPDLIPQAVAAPTAAPVPVTPQAAQALQARNQMLFNKKNKELKPGQF